MFHNQKNEKKSYLNADNLSKLRLPLQFNFSPGLPIIISNYKIITTTFIS